MRYFLTFICASILLTACHKDDPEEPQTEVERTVLVYIAGENSLSSFIWDELKEMREGSKLIGENNNLVVYVDAASKFTKPYLLRLKNGEGVDSVSMAESLVSDPEVFSGILNEVFEKYPANEYGLVLWGHANGWLIKEDSVAHNTPASSRRRAYGIDSGNNTENDAGTWMNIPTMAKTLEATGKKLKFIFADCCQFQCVESAYELRKTCDYIIASPAEIPGVGAPYETMVTAMFSRSDNFYEEMVDAYYEQTVGYYKEPLSVVKTSGLENLAVATKAILGTFVPKLSNPRYPDVDGLIYYQGDRWGDTKSMIDMNDFMLQNADENEYLSWKQALDQVIIYKTPTIGLNGMWMSQVLIDFKSFTLDDKHFGGISMFVPAYSMSMRNYNILIQKTGWYHAAGYSELGW